MKERYEIKGWNGYAKYHLSVLTSFQKNVYEEAAGFMKGSIADFGCGTGRMMAFVQDRPKVDAYFGVDAAEEMVQCANWLRIQLCYKQASVTEGFIESIKGRQFDAAVSINSYYAWPEPKKVLAHIYALLKPKGIFVLVTPNKKFNVEKLGKAITKELLGHPDFEAFYKINSTLVGNEARLFVNMDTLIREAQAAGFRVKQCHQEHFLGGMNFLVLEKL